MDGKFIREDHDKIQVTYPRLTPTKLYPNPAKEICLSVKGLSTEVMIKNLNDRNIFVFKSCSPALITITFTPQNDTALAKSESAAELKNIGSKAKGGNTLLGMLLVSSIQTEVPVVKAAELVSIKSKTEEVSHQYETQYLDSHYVKSEQNKNGKIDLEIEFLKLVSSQIWSVIASVWKRESETLEFAIIKPYYEDFKWNLHHEDYHRALVVIDLLMKEHDSVDLYYNRGILNEYFGDYEKALCDNEMSKELGLKSVIRVKNEISRLTSVKRTNENLLKLR